VAEGAAHARKTLTGRINGNNPFWNNYRRSHPTLPDARWPKVWEHVYRSMVRELAEAMEAACKAARPPSPHDALAAALVQLPELPHPAAAVPLPQDLDEYVTNPGREVSLALFLIFDQRVNAVRPLLRMGACQIPARLLIWHAERKPARPESGRLDAQETHVIQCQRPGDA